MEFILSRLSPSCCRRLQIPPQFFTRLALLPTGYAWDDPRRFCGRTAADTSRDCGGSHGFGCRARLLNVYIRHLGL